MFWYHPISSRRTRCKKKNSAKNLIIAQSQKFSHHCKQTTSIYSWQSSKYSYNYVSSEPIEKKNMPNNLNPVLYYIWKKNHIQHLNVGETILRTAVLLLLFFCHELRRQFNNSTNYGKTDKTEALKLQHLLIR